MLREEPPNAQVSTTEGEYGSLFVLLEIEPSVRCRHRDPADQDHESAWPVPPRTVLGWETRGLPHAQVPPCAACVAGCGRVVANA
jgi:hypothetical protein